MRKITAQLLYVLSILFLFSIPINVSAQSEGGSAQSYSEPFDINNPFEMDLIFDVKGFIKAKDTEEYLDAKIAYKNFEGESIERNVKIRARGNVRKRICYLPPIRIHFDDEDYQVDLFDSFGKVKLVSTCKVAANQEQFLIKEYLSYKIYETITDISFKTYYMKINFIDSQGKKKPYTSYSFILEDIDDLAERNNAIEVENMGLLESQLDKQTMDLFSMYQYLISNVDWHIPSMHNVKLIKSNDHKKPLPMPVPYDLDYCGIVNTNYAIPQPRVPIESLTDRYWIGNCLTDEEFSALCAPFLESKDEIINIFEACESLDKIHKKTAVRFINQFYSIIEKDEKQAKRTILKDCNQ
jgi:hypothetical protein